MDAYQFIKERENEVEDLCENWSKSYLAYVMEQYHKQRIEAGQHETIVMWRSVEDEMPDKETTCIVGKFMNGYFIQFMMYYGLSNYESGKCDWFYDDDIVKDHLRPTHWRLLPESPQDT